MLNRLIVQNLLSGFQMWTPWAETEMWLLILEVWILLFIAAARFLPQIDTISSQMGLRSADSKLRSGYVEGYGTSAVMNCLRGRDHLLHLPLKFIFKLTCEKAQRVFKSPPSRVMCPYVGGTAASLLTARFLFCCRFTAEVAFIATPCFCSF